jgi:glycosyltransferase involved in cell wall biosynthesis
MATIMSISVSLITMDEEQNIRRTLESVKWADEIVVVDSGSSDRTCDIAREYGAKIFIEPWKGFSAQKNSSIEKCTGDWVLSLDADEELTPACVQELQTVVTSPGACDGYFIRRRNHFMGRWIRWGGGYPDSKLRFFKRGTASFKERAVHEEMLGQGKIGMLHGDMLHHAYPNLTLFIEHMNRYSTLGAEINHAKGKGGFSVLNIVVSPIVRFIYNYVFRAGFLDGREGLLFHLYHSVYMSWKYSKAWELGRAQKRVSPSGAGK